MSNALLVDCLMSALAGLALLGLRIRLRRLGLAPRLMRTLRLATGLWGVFYLLRVPAWLGEAHLGERFLLMTAALIPASLLLVAEAALRRHAPPAMKWAVLSGTPVLMTAALVWPAAHGGWYLAALALFQIALIGATGWFVWTWADTLNRTEARQMRTFGSVALISLPLIVTDFGILGELHLSALAVLCAVWLAVSSASWMTGPRPALLAVGCLLVLALAGAWVMGMGGVGIACLLAILFFAALLGDAARGGAAGLSAELATFLARPSSEVSAERLAAVLAEQDAMLVSGQDMQGYDLEVLTQAFEHSPLWTGDSRGEDAQDQMVAIARQMEVTHLLATGLVPLQLIGFTLAPSQASAQAEYLLRAAGRRLCDAG